MAVRQFDGVDDDIRHAIGALAGMTHGTFAALVKVQAPTGEYSSILSLSTSSNVLRAQWYYDEDVEWHNIFVPNRSTQVPLTGYANQWALLVARKASGNVPVTFSLYRFNQGQWTHASSSNFANWTSPGANGIVARSLAGDEYFRGLIAVQAVWANSVPFANNTAVQNAGLHQSLDAWFDAEPDALWAFNQESVTDPVNDLTGNGADQIARTGTAVVTNDDPPGFVWGSSGDDQFGEGSVSAAATVEATGQRIIVHRGSGSALAEAIVAATGVRSAVGAGVVVAEAQVGASGERTAFAAGEVEAQASASASGERTTFGAGAVSAVSSVEAAGGRTVAGAGSVEAAASVAATGRVSASTSGHVVASSTVEATGRRTASGEGSVEAAASVSATGVRTVRGAGSVQAGSDVSATGVRTAVGFGAVQAAATVAAVGSAGLKRGRGRVEAFASVQAEGLRTARARGFVRARGIGRVRVPIPPSPPSMAYRSWMRFRPRH
ncbi:MAG TPA: hypothetical protein VK028_00525 [Micromonosporaceae bacterium]|nr:hypothetical protein [Micromonosporaceae bacterium]